MPTQTYSRDGGTPVPVTGSAIETRGGTYDLDTSNVAFTAAYQATLSYSEANDGNTIVLQHGGSVELHGSGNTVTVDAGSLTVGEEANTNRDNTINLGSGVTQFTGSEIGPTDAINLAGFTQANLDAAFAHLDQHSHVTETATISNAETGRTLVMVFNSPSGTNMPAEAQFHVSPPSPPPQPPAPGPGDNSGASSLQGGSSGASPPSATAPAPQPPPSNPGPSSQDSGSPPPTTGTSSPPASPPSAPQPPTVSVGVPSPAPSTPPVATVPKPDPNTPTPLSPEEAGALAGLNPAQAGAMTFLDDGAHVGADLQSLGEAISAGQDTTPFVGHLAQDVRQLLSAYVAASPGLAQGVTGPSGMTLAIPGQFVTDLANLALQGAVAGSAPLDGNVSTAFNTFFGAVGTTFVGHG